MTARQASEPENKGPEVDVARFVQIKKGRRLGETAPLIRSHLSTAASFEEKHVASVLRNSDSINSIPSTANLPELLERAGFRIRGRRADCLHCEGHSHLTVSFTDEVAYCHRCAWKTNARTLARELGLPVAPETRDHRERRARAALFSAWLNTCHTILTRRLWRLLKRANLAKMVLAQYPDCEPAWGALAAFYHNEALLMGALDLLAFEKVSPWLERPMTRQRLAAAFDGACARVGTTHAN